MIGWNDSAPLRRGVSRILERALAWTFVAFIGWLITCAVVWTVKLP